MVTYNRPEQATDTLAAVAEQTRRLDTMTIVDNAPWHGAEQRFERAWGTALTYLAMADNLGPAGGIARGMCVIIENAEPDDWLLLIDDDDPPPHAGVVERLAGLAGSLRLSDDRVAGVGLVGARFDLRRGRVVRLRDDQLEARAASVDHIGGNQFPLYRVRAILDVGPFDDQLFFGFEELEFGLRLVDAGWHLYSDGEGRLERRAESGRLGIGAPMPARRLNAPNWRTYYSRRNLLVILRRHGAWAGMVRVALVGLGKPMMNLPRAPILALRALRMQCLAVLHGCTGRTGKRVIPDREGHAR